MDLALIGTVILGAAFLPSVLEVMWQTRLLSRFLTVLPDATRAALPPHPSRPWLAVAGSTRFFLAVWRCFRRDFPGDPAPVTTLKRKMRASLHRELVWTGGAATVLVVLIRIGWRPTWPW
jgi:hypothetical protein